MIVEADDCMRMKSQASVQAIVPAPPKIRAQNPPNPTRDWTKSRGVEISDDMAFK